jgi:aminoglycoside phosphotransferase (APT) family kinase protein
VLAARLPRREAAARLVVHEQRWLPVLVPRLPLPVPAPVRIGQPGPGYPWPWSIVPFLPGQVAARNPPADPRDAAFSLGGLVDRGAVRRVWEAAVTTPPWDRSPVWLHGDLHPANVLVHRGRISGVIDFGDLTSGDPATDLSVAWMLLPTECHDVFQNAYRAAGQYAADGSIWARARGWALALSLVFLAHSADNPQLADIGHRTISAILG